MKSTLSFCLALCLLAARPTTAGPLTLSVLPTSSSHDVGTVFSVEIALTDAIDLISYQFDLGFNQAVLTATTVTWGPFLESGGATITSIGSIDNTAGLIDSIADVLLAGSVSGSGVLASVQFQVIGTGTSGLTLVNPLFFDENFVGLSPVLEEATVTGTPGSITPVPEASTLLLTAPLAIGLWWRRRRRPVPSSAHTSSPAR